MKYVELACRVLSSWIKLLLGRGFFFTVVEWAFLYKYKSVVLQTAMNDSTGAGIKDQIIPSCIKIHNNELNTKLYSTIHENKQIKRVIF
jgi:hypothetical protein